MTYSEEYRPGRDYVVRKKTEEKVLDTCEKEADAEIVCKRFSGGQVTRAAAVCLNGVYDC